MEPALQVDQPVREVKGYVFRALVTALQRLKLDGQVVPDLPPSVRRYVLDPPPVSAWVDEAILRAVVDATMARVGEPAMRRLGKEIALGSLGPLQPIIQGMFRLFGMSPVAILSHQNLLSRGASRGLLATYTFTPTSPRSGDHVYEDASCGRLTPGTVSLNQGVLEAIVGLCSPSVVVGRGEIVEDGRGNKARFAIRW